MPVFRLTDELLFPPPELADPDGLLAVGADLSCKRLLLAYSMGIFPWYDRKPILWWSPEPRFILELDNLHISRKLAKTLRRKEFTLTIDRAFTEVVTACARTPRKGVAGTWINVDMIRAYSRLFAAGFAHSVECWRDEKLAGGLYGVCLGRCFFGESMFHRAPDASKAALVYLVDYLKARNFELLDCQIANDHLRSLGAAEISRAEFLERLRRGGVYPGVSPPLSNFHKKPPQTHGHPRRFEDR